MMLATKQDYLNSRKELLDKAGELLNAGKLDEGTAKMAEVERLDEEFEKASKAQANLNALQGIVSMNNALFEEGRVVDTMGEVMDNMFGSKEYRLAFMDFVTKGEAIPVKFLNADANTKTSDVGAVIPTTVMERIIEKMESTGSILNLVTRTSYKGGLTIPTSSVKPVASWVTEGAGSDRQKKTTGTITFAYHKLRCAVSVSLETDVMALPVFETTIINNISEAMVKAIEQAIINGDGSGKPKGILQETVAAGQNVDITAGSAPDYESLCAAEGKLPLAYESNALWLMHKTTFMKYIGMVDADGQPIARINYGISGKPERTLLGRTVIVNDYMPAYTGTVTDDTVIAFLFNPKDYILNTNLNVTIKTFEDNDTDDTVTKAVMLVDGKVVDVNSLVTVTAKKA